MDQKTDLGEPAESRAEAALELLRSLARAGQDPDKFAQACLDWSRLSEDATAIPEFQSVLDMLAPQGSGQTTETRAGAAVDFEMQSGADPSDVFQMTAAGIVSRIGNDLSEALALKVGDAVDPSLFQRLANTDIRTTGGFLLELHDRFRIARQVQIYPMIAQGETEGYLAHVMRSHLHVPVREYLRQKFELTLSEMDILELVLRRYSLEQIGEIRRTKLNTVRTHIARIIRKLGCHSLVEAVSTTVELSNAFHLRGHLPRIEVEPEDNNSRRIALNKPGTLIEYRRYGASTGRAVMVLHSLEYGFIPSPAMIEAARHHNINLVFPIRPGFGDTALAGSQKEAAALMSGFLKALDLMDVTLVGLSTAAPLALEIQEHNKRISQTVLVNYALNVPDKLKNIQPAWIRGLLRMAMNSPASFGFGMRTLKSMIKTFGGLRFYRMLYGNQVDDAAFLEENEAIFQASSDYLIKADRGNLRLDIISAFMPNREVETLLSRPSAITVINSADQHGVGPDETGIDADRLGIAFKHVSHGGRNWMFQHPNDFFDLLNLKSAH